VIDYGQNTQTTFEKIQTLATNAYRQHCDFDFKDLPLASREQTNFVETHAITLNNRAVFQKLNIFTTDEGQPSRQYSNAVSTLRRR